jgi:SAM-dependent methyltransferase/uncharacterized protein YbaR (Trm112 family)
MKHRALDFLACPACRSGLSLEAFSSESREHIVNKKIFCRHHCSFYRKSPKNVDCSTCFKTEVLEGLLTCKKCGRQYPIIRGIPRILPDAFMKDLARKNSAFFQKYSGMMAGFQTLDAKSSEEDFKRRTARSFGFQWTAFPGIIGEFRDNFLKYIEPIKPGFFTGKLVLDAGCGFGRHTYYAAEFGAEVVGFDLSDAVEAAYSNTSHFPHAHIIQGDIYNPPFRRDFDFILSIGVLHHLPRPEDGFLSLADILEPGKPIFIWLYGKNGKFFRMKVVEGMIRKFTVRMPARMLYYVCYIPAAAYHSFNILFNIFNTLGLKRLANKMPFKNYARFPFMVKHADSYDLLGTPVNNYYSKEDVEKWLEDAKLKDTWVSQMGGWSWRAYGAKKAQASRP